MLNVFAKIFGNKNDREVKKYRKRANAITSLESKYEKLSDEELQNCFEELKQAVLNNRKKFK